MTLQEKQAPIDAAIVRAMISATPETWQAIQVVAFREANATVESVRIEIASPEGHHDLVAPTEELQDALLDLLSVFNQHGSPWRKVEYQASVGADGNWRFAADFAY